MWNLIKSVVILITVLISTTGAQEVVYAKVGDTVTLKPHSSEPTNYLYWKFGDLQLAWRNHLGGHGFTQDEKWKSSLSLAGDSLVITNIKQEWFGIFHYELRINQNTRATSYRLIRLNVDMKSPSSLLPGEFLSLDCNVDTPGGQKKPEIYWLNPQSKRMDGGKINRKVTSQDNGQWTCVVKNDQKETKTTVSVTVVDFSGAPSLPQYTYTSKISPLTVPCSIPSHITWEQIKAKDIQEVYWEFVPKGASSGDRQKLFSLLLPNLTCVSDQSRGLRPASDPKKGNLTLTRKQGKEGDSGVYTCIMKLKNGETLSRTVHVEVLKIIASPGTDLISGQQLNLTCNLGRHLSPDLQVKWSPPPLSSLNSDPHPEHLTIPEVGTVDSGKWGCELWQNRTRLTSDMITLKIKPRLSVWMLVIICSAVVIVILLLILFFILHRRSQRKMRHPRHRLCQCKNPKPKGFYRT